mgnify:CR=1 FL=1
MKIPPQHAPVAPRLLDIQQVAIYTGLSVHTLYTMVSQRRIPFVKIGRLTKFDLHEIDKWIAGHSVKVRRSFAAIAPLTDGS